MTSLLAKLTDEQKEQAVQQVMENLKNKTESEQEQTQEDSDEPEIDFGDIEFIEDEGESEMSDDKDNPDLMDSIQSLSDELDIIKEDGKVDSSEVVGLFQSMMEMVNELLRAKPGRKRRTPKASMQDRVACSFLRNSARGMQTKRKDKDLMSDTGGTSKGREREPSQKPPREEMKKPYRTKDKPAQNRDKDTDNDKDLK
jgi:hypothetical protein